MQKFLFVTLSAVALLAGCGSHGVPSVQPQNSTIVGSLDVSAQARAAVTKAFTSSGHRATRIGSVSFSSTVENVVITAGSRAGEVSFTATVVSSSTSHGNGQSNTSTSSRQVTGTWSASTGVVSSDL